MYFPATLHILRSLRRLPSFSLTLNQKECWSYDNTVIKNSCLMHEEIDFQVTVCAFSLKILYTKYIFTPVHKVARLKLLHIRRVTR